jgi:hypothetical protein
MLYSLLSESVILRDYTKYSKAVATAYVARPVKDVPEVLRSWKILRDHNLKMFKRLQSRVEVIWTEEDPYKSQEEMKVKVLSTGKLYINNQFSENLSSGWTPEDNWKFRAVHDYVVHIGGDVTFSERGEIQAFNVHAKLVPPTALDALFSEVVAQVCYVHTFGDFPNPQKASKLYGFDYNKVGLVDWDEYRLNFTENAIKEYSSEEIDAIIEDVRF